jgi:eukaryotic-like serine/threonine-protein kinase
MPLSPGQILNNRYRIVKLLGQGGYGAVYKAWHLNLNIVCAIKENLDTSAEAQRQFAREATLLATLRHPNLPRVIDHFSMHGQGQYLVMDYVEGDDLQVMLDRIGGPLPEAAVLPWIIQVCDALSYMHSQKPPVIHRDIKPANIKITPQGQAVLVDFGIAKVYNPNLKTTKGARGVTPGYSPPEQYGQGTTDLRSDIYCLGATLYTLLTNQVPTESVQRTLGAALPAPRLLNLQISHAVENAILRALAVQPNDRYQSMVQFASALQRPRPVAGPFPSKIPANPQPAYSPAPRRFLWRWILGGILALAFLFVGERAINYFSNQSTATPSKRLAAEQFTHTPRASATPLRLTPTPTSLPPTETITPEPPTITPTPTLEIKGFQISDKDGMKLLYVPAGEFLMGSTDPNSQAKFDEKPQHTVNLDAFWIDQTEVTNAMYSQCVQTELCQSPSNTTFYADTQFGNYPVVYVSWNDAQAYCQWAGRKLPTEAQWEKAARGTDGRTYPWGEDISCEKANYFGCIGKASAVGSYPSGASPYGALDMAGNGLEWVSDWYDPNYYASSPSSNPTGPVTGQERVLRGGSWFYEALYLRTADRDRVSSDERRDLLGFRCSG